MVGYCDNLLIKYFEKKIIELLEVMIDINRSCQWRLCIDVEWILPMKIMHGTMIIIDPIIYLCSYTTIGYKYGYSQKLLSYVIYFKLDL